MKRAKTLVSAALVAGFVALSSTFGCGDPSHLFTGVSYDEARDCVGVSGEAIDVVEGEDPGLGCALQCFVGRGVLTSAPDGASIVYLSTMCPPYPVSYTTDGTDPRCKKAIAAREEGRRCLEDGGVSPAADAGKDATIDATVTDAGLAPDAEPADATNHD